MKSTGTTGIVMSDSEYKQWKINQLEELNASFIKAMIAAENLPKEVYENLERAKGYFDNSMIHLMELWDV